jgi:hypothetical protein
VGSELWFKKTGGEWYHLANLPPKDVVATKHANGEAKFVLVSLTISKHVCLPHQTKHNSTQTLQGGRVFKVSTSCEVETLFRVMVLRITFIAVKMPQQQAYSGFCSAG